MKLFRQDGPPLASPVEPTANARRIAALGFFDPLTRLRNRRCFDHVMARRVREGCAGFGLIIVDIDRLKIINSTLGHAAGDSLIREVAARLRAARVGKQIFRLSSDEFAVVDEASTSHAELARTAARIVERMNVGMQLTGIRMMPQVSMGGAVHGVDGVTCEMLRQNADMALQEAKKTNRGGYVPFAEPLRRHVRQHQGVIVAVDDALESGRIMTYYQPLARLDTREIVGLEALSRMRSTDGMVVAGGSFQAAFADPCLSYRLTDQMLAHVAR